MMDDGEAMRRRDRLAETVAGKCLDPDSEEGCDPVACAACRVDAALEVEAVEGARCERNAILDFVRRSGGSEEIVSWLIQRGEIERVRPQDLGWRSVDELFIPVGATGALLDRNIRVLRDFIALSEEEVLALKGIGPKAFTQIQRRLRELGLTLRTEVPCR